MRAVAFDTETTGVDVYNDRIVTAYLGIVDDNGNIEQEKTWIIDPGIDIPTGASDVHGFTTERIRVEGCKDIAAALEEIFAVIEYECASNGLPLVGYNLSYDLTLLESERKRHIPGHLALDFERVHVLDSLVLDKGVDKYRRGSRKLIDTAKHYGVPITADEAHAASFDAVASARIALRLLQHPALHSRDPQELHRLQVKWHAEQAAGLQAYLRSAKNKNGADPDAYCDPGWPLYVGRPTTTATQEAA